MSGAVAGREADLELEPGELERLAARDRVVGVVALERSEPWPRHVLHDVGEHLGLELRAVDGRAGRARDGRDRADVVEVGVGEEDRLELGDLQRSSASISRGASSPGSKITALSESLTRDDVGVLLHWTDREHPHVDHFEAAFLRIRRRHR